MPDRERDTRDEARNLEQELRDIGSHLDYPQTPDLASAARRRIEAEEAGRADRRGLSWLPALSPRWAVAAMFVIVLAVPVLSPAARDTLSGMLSTGGMSSGAGGSAAEGGSESADQPSDNGEARRDAPMSAGSPEAQQESATSGQEAPVPESGGGRQAESSASSSGSQGGAIYGGGNGHPDRKYAEKITLREARILAVDEYVVLLPRTKELDKPDAVYKISNSHVLPLTGWALVYRAEPGLPAFGDSGVGMVLTEMPIGTVSVYVRGLKNKVGFEEVSVGDRRGYWMSSRPAYWVPGLRRGPSSSQAETGSVLYWEQDGTALRLESKLGKEEAIRIAESVR